MNKEQVIEDAIAKYFIQKRKINVDAMTGHLDRCEDDEVKIMLTKIFSDIYDEGLASAFTSSPTVNVEDLNRYNFRQWYKAHQPELYEKYGKCILCIDKKTKEIMKVYDTSKLNESVHYCIQNDLVNQLCDETFYGETIWVY